MAYRTDNDLDFLKGVSSADLDTIVEILIKDKKGKGRITEGLTACDEYKAYSPDHHQYWEVIAAEIQCFGANSLVTVLRGGEGVLYKEVLINACSKMKVNFSKDASVEMIEMNLLMKILTEAMVDMSADELKEVVNSLKLKTTDFTSQAVTVALRSAVTFSGFAAYKVSVIVANAVAKSLLGHGLKFAANNALARGLGVFAGPIGWSVSGIWALVSIAGPAYRVTIPTVIQVAFLRAKLQYGKQAGEEELELEGS